MGICHSISIRVCSFKFAIGELHAVQCRCTQYVLSSDIFIGTPSVHAFKISQGFRIMYTIPAYKHG